MPTIHRENVIVVIQYNLGVILKYKPNNNNNIIMCNVQPHLI